MKHILLSSSRTNFLAVGAAMALMLTITSPAYADTLTRQLQFGMSGADVSALQTYLAQDQTIYPQGLVTGYFGFLTKSAVSNWQARNNISTVGRVGPITLAALNQEIGGVTSGDVVAPVISNLSLTTSTSSANIHWDTNEPARGIVYYSTSQVTMAEKYNDVEITGTSAISDTTLLNSQNISMMPLLASTTYYYIVYSKDAAGNVAVTWPSNFKTQ